MSGKPGSEIAMDTSGAQSKRRAEWAAESPEEQEEAGRRWQFGHADAIRSMNACFEKHGFPFRNTGDTDGTA